MVRVRGDEARSKATLCCEILGTCFKEDWDL